MSASVKPVADGTAGTRAVVADVEKGSETKITEARKNISWQEEAKQDDEDEELITENTSMFACLHKIQKEPWAKAIDDFLSRNLAWSIVVMILTVWALFMDDLLYLLLPKEADMVFFVISWVIFFIFFTEVVLDSIVERDYIFSLVMLMDLLAAVSLIPFTLLVEQEIDSSTDETMDDAAVARIARTFRALRILRATRAAAMTLKTTTVIKRAAQGVDRARGQRRASIGKIKTLSSRLQELSVNNSSRGARSQSVASSAGMEELRQELKKERRKMAEEEGSRSVLEETLLVRTNAKMLLGILVLLMGTTLMQADEIDMTMRSGLEILDTSATALSSAGSTIDQSSLVPLTDKYVDLVEKKNNGETSVNSGRVVMQLIVHGIEFVNKDMSKYRTVELHTVSFKLTNTSSIVSVKGLRDVDNLLSIGITIFSVLVIVIWAESFRLDHQSFVIKPVNRMIKHLKHMAEDPRLAIGALALVSGRKKSKKAKKSAGSSGEMETIESCVARFGMLLQVGFGEAGMGIISSNMGDGGKFNPVVEGVKVFAIFGFCDIRNFTDCCEVLEEETMIFTNQIALIVHQHVHKSGGSVNKNIGDAFLTVWKLNIPPEEETLWSVPIGDSANTPMHSEENSKIADTAMQAFVRTRYLLETDEKIQILGQDERLQKKLPGYTVRMGYGLHFGWAIEGAVGSKYKVDATYLSPHVNMSARLESSSKQFGVQMLFSGPFYNALGKGCQDQCRPMDCVTVKGSNVPVMLYTHQISEFASRGLTKEQNKEFDNTWLQAFNLYREGKNWPKAQQLMNRCLEIAPDDPPTKLLLKVMNGGDAPADWKGYRPLTEK
jgi:class 3 adenylate cyclase